jgi:hypothetical protein
MLRSLSLAGALVASTSLAAPAAAAQGACLAGEYDGGQMEIAAGLSLKPDGRFRYALSYGALDERAQGRWESQGGTVLLTSDPVNPPRFALIGEAPGADGAFRLHLDLPDGISPQYFNALAVLSDGRTIGSPLGYEDWVIPLEPGEKVVSVKLQLPVMDLESERIALAAGTGSTARVRFEPNDLGTVAFVREPLAIDASDLLLTRHERALRFHPTSGGCKY